MKKEYTHYADEMLNVELDKISIEASSYFTIKDEDLEENPLPKDKTTDFSINYGL